MGDNMKKYIKVVGFVLALGLFIFMPKLLKQETKAVKVDRIEVPELIQVELVGEVNIPGLYEVKPGTTYQTLFAYAYGLTMNADVDLINLYEPIMTNMVITIPAKNEVVVSKVNINQANKETLMTIPYIGSVTADKIITYRQENGAFIAIDELMNVSGIGVQTFEKIKHLITI